MPQSSTAVLVVIASPGDAAEERAAVRDALNDWNINRGRRDKIALLPWLWERHAVARIGDRPQALINAQAVDRSDVVVAFFDSRLGTSTGVDVSGTAEEINRAADLGKPVHVYFSEEPLPRDADLEQVAALNAFKAELETRGIMGSYGDPADLTGQVIRAIEADIEENGWARTSEPAPPGPKGADLHWSHLHEREHSGFDRRGNPKYRSTANDLVVRNDGDVAAEDLTFEVKAVGDTEFHFEAPDGPVTIQPRSEMAWLLVPMPHMGAVGRTVEIAATWREGDLQQTATRTVALRH